MSYSEYLFGEEAFYPSAGRGYSQYILSPTDKVFKELIFRKKLVSIIISKKIVSKIEIKSKQVYKTTLGSKNWFDK